MLVIDKLVLNTSYSFIQITANLIGLGAFYGSLNELTHTWFIGYILICYLITPLLDLIFKKQKNKNYLWILLIIVFIFDFFSVTNISASHLCIYILGFWFSRCLKEKEQNKFTIIIILISLLALPLKIICKYDLINLPTIISTYKEHIWLWTHSLLGISIFLILYKLFNKLNIKNNLFLSYSDKYNFAIYLTHQIFILNSFSLLHITKNLFLNIIIILICCIISGILLTHIAELLESVLKKIVYLILKKEWKNN